MENMNNKVRDSRFELLRLVAILMVVLSHFSLFGQEHRLQLDPSLWDRIGADLFTPFGKVGVGLFVLITGYFLGNKQSTIISAVNRGWKIWAETIFYTTFMFVAFAIFSREISFGLLIKSIIPVTTVLYWFVTSYIVLILLSPIINLVSNQASQKQFQYLIAVTMILNFMIPVLQINFELMILLPYLLGSYLKKYGMEIKHKGVYLTLILLLSYVLIIVLNTRGHGLALTIGIIPTITALLIFLIVLDFKPFHSNIINKFATTSFAGYLITEFPPMRNLLWNNLLALSNVDNALVADLIGFIAILLILYIGVFLIDLIRQKIFKVLGVDNTPQHILAFLKNNKMLNRFYI